MKNTEKSNQSNLDGVNLLVSILVCYPEIGTLRFEPQDDSLRITFILGKKVTEEELKIAKNLLRKSVLAYHTLERIENAVVSIKTNHCGEMVFLNVVRDVESLSKGEIALITMLLKDMFGENLIYDSNTTNIEEEGIIQDDFIDNMIGCMKLNHAVERLIGIREDGRVMIFNK